MMWSNLLLLAVLLCAKATSESIVLCDQEYKITKLLGKGGQGRVYLALGQNLTKNVAIKVLPIEPDYREYVDNEVRIHSSITGLPNIVSLFCAEEIDSHMYLVMEYCPGGFLEHFQTRSNSHSRQERTTWISQLAIGIQSLLSVNVVHRDLKPENCLICANGELKISDFGFARHLKPGHRFSKQFPGTPPYAAPELLQRKPYDSQVDAWGVGHIVYYILKQSYPFRKRLPVDSNASLNAIVSFFRTHRSVKAPFQSKRRHKEIVKRLLQFKPEKRMTLAQFVTVVQH